MPTKTATGSGRNVAAELVYLTRTLKAPSLAAAVDRPTRSSWPPVCNVRSPPGSPTAVRPASVLPGSPRAKRWRTSTSTTSDR